MKNKRDLKIIKFPTNLTEAERQIEAILFAALEPLDVETIKSRLKVKGNVEKILEEVAKVTIVSSDKDLMQLYKKNVRIYDPMKNKFINEEDISNKFGVRPEKVVDVQALAGDSTDNVPGVPGIGVKTAAELINEYGNLDYFKIKNEENLKKFNKHINEYYIKI